MTSEAVTLRHVKNLAVITIDNPPVNALDLNIRRSICAALDRVAQDDSDAVILCGAGRMFSAGADIREFGTSPTSPTLPEVCGRVEASRKPVVALLHGSTLGGALELALSAHYRVATGDAELGLPEVRLGLIPGAGGTQRLPRLIGIGPALQIMLSGDRINVHLALTLGLVDKVVIAEAPLSAAMACIEEILASHACRPTWDAMPTLTEDTATRAALDAARTKLSREGMGLFAPGRIIEAVEASLTMTFEQGLLRERELFRQCVASPQHAALKHAFFAERQAAKTPEATSATPRPIRRVGIVGAGTMGAGIATTVLEAGLPVTLVDRDVDALARATRRVGKIFDGYVTRNRMSSDDKALTFARLTASTSIESLADCDLVIEAVFEDMAAKTAVFAELERICKRNAVLATNTSYLDVNAISGNTSRPADVLGLHFFSPAHAMKLIEIVVPDNASNDAVATSFALAKQLRKIPVRSGVCDGFIGNRILTAYRQSADAMMEDGASPYQIDEAIREFGFPMGPYQMADLAGGDIGWATRKRRAAARDPNARYVQIADRLCERGWFGQKSGRGYYIYPHGERTGQPDPEVETLIAEERLRTGIKPRVFTKEAIVQRYLAAMINEGANVVRDGIARRPLDVDVVLLFGYGFPCYRGGPMKFADMIGVQSILTDINEFSKEDAHFWKPSPLLVELTERGMNFDSLNTLDDMNHA